MFPVTSAELNYLDFATDAAKFLLDCHSKGLHYSIMISISRYVCEMYLKHILDKKMLNNSNIMMSRDLRTLYDAVVKSGADITACRRDVMLLHGYFRYTEFPSKDSFLATSADIDDAVDAIINIAKVMGAYF